MRSTAMPKARGQAGAYNPDEKDPVQRWFALAQVMKEAGFGLDAWLLGMMDRLASCPNGDRKLEAEILVELQRRLQIQQLDESEDIFEKPPASSFGGEIVLGNCVDSCNGAVAPTLPEVALPKAALREHGLIVAKTGGGKTSLLALIALACAEHFGIMLFEVEKLELQYIYPLLRKRGIKLGFLSWRDSTICFNPCEAPPGVKLGTWISELAEIFQTAYSFPPGALRAFKGALRQQYEEHGAYDGSGDFGDLMELAERIEARPRVPAPARNALLERLEDLTDAFRDGGLNYSKGYPIQEMEKGHWLFMLAGLPLPIKTLITGYYVSYLFRRRQEPGAKQNPLLVVVEEARELITKPNAHLSQCLNQVRGAGISMIFATQEGTRVNEDIRNACSLKIVGNVDEPEMRELAPSLGLSAEQRAWWIDNKQKRLFLLKSDLLPHRKAFPLWTANVELPTELPEEEVRQTQEELLGRLREGVVPATGRTMPSRDTTEGGDAPTVGAGTATGRTGAVTGRAGAALRKKPRGSTSKVSETHPVDGDQIAYLSAIVRDPDRPSSQYDTIVEIEGKRGVGRAKGSRLREGLIRGCLVRVFDISTGGRKDYKILRPTEKGLDRVGSDLRRSYLSEFPPADQQHPGAAHDHKIRVIVAAFERHHFVAKREHDIQLPDGRTIRLDLYAESMDRSERVGVEVQETEMAALPDKAASLQAAACLTEKHLVVPTRGSIAHLNGLNCPDVKIETLSAFMPSLHAKPI